MVTLKLLYILISFYEEIYIYKPFLSRLSISEKYIICKNFKYVRNKNKKSFELIIQSLEKCLENMNSNDYIYDIYPDLELSNNYINKIKFINIKLANLQQILINNIVKYIKENNYFGDKYHNYHDKQKNTISWWINIFYPTNVLDSKNKDLLNKIVVTTLDKYNAEFNKFDSILIK